MFTTCNYVRDKFFASKQGLSNTVKINYIFQVYTKDKL